MMAEKNSFKGSFGNIPFLCLICKFQQVTLRFLQFMPESGFGYFTVHHIHATVQGFGSPSAVCILILNHGFYKGLHFLLFTFSFLNKEHPDIQSVLGIFIL